ncbi:reverse transcriptase domain-containing protein [Tanacetum coccineum]
MSKSVLEELSLAERKNANMTVEMADKTRCVPQGIIENVLVKIDKFSFTSDFVIIDTKESNNKTIILGRPFLVNIHAEINVSTREVSLGIKEDRDNKLGGQTREKTITETREDPEKCGETKTRAIIGEMVNKLPKEWFSGVSKDKDDLEGINDYLEPTLYDGFIDLDDKAYKLRRNKLLGMPYTEHPPILKEEAKITRYNLGASENPAARRQLSRPARLIIMWGKSLRKDRDNLKDLCQISILEAMLREFLVLILVAMIIFEWEPFFSFVIKINEHHVFDSLILIHLILLRAVAKALAQEEQSLLLRNIIKKEHPHTGWKLCQKTKVAQKDTRSQGQKSKGQALRMVDLSQQWVCEDNLICSLRDSLYFDLPNGSPNAKSRHKTYDEARIRRSFKIFQAAGKSGTLGECQHGLYVQPPTAYRIPQGFMHGITNPELIKRLHDKILKSVDEMMRITMSFLRGRWQLQRSERRQDGFTLLLKSPKEILALEKGKFESPPLMMTQVEKINSNKFCEFHGEVGHNTENDAHEGNRRIAEELEIVACNQRIKAKQWEGSAKRKQKRGNV